MYETEAELDELQLLLDRSMNQAGAHTRSIFKDEHRLSARQISSYMQGVRQVALATVNSKGEPMVSPVDSVFFHGRFYVSTDRTSLRARHLVKTGLLSLAYFEGADPVLIVHGSGDFIGIDDPTFTALDSEWTRCYGQSITRLSETVAFIRANPRTMLAYSFRADDFEER